MSIKWPDLGVRRGNPPTAGLASGLLRAAARFQALGRLPQQSRTMPAHTLTQPRNTSEARQSRCSQDGARAQPLCAANGTRTGARQTRPSSREPLDRETARYAPPRVASTFVRIGQGRKWVSFVCGDRHLARSLLASRARRLRPTLPAPPERRADAPTCVSWGCTWKRKRAAPEATRRWLWRTFYPSHLRSGPRRPQSQSSTATIRSLTGPQ